MKVALPLMKNVVTPLTKRFLIPLGLMVAASAANAAIQKKIYGSDMTTLIVTNKEMKYIIK